MVFCQGIRGRLDSHAGGGVSARGWLLVIEAWHSAWPRAWPSCQLALRGRCCGCCGRCRKKSSLVSRRTWYAGRVSLDVTVRGTTIPPEDLSWRFSRSPGPGGQSVNTTDSRAELSYNLAASGALLPLLKERALRALEGRLADGVITVTASEHRSQLRNREAAAARMSAVLTDATAPPPRSRRPTRPSRAAKERRLAEKQRRSRTKRLRRSTDD